ncbi:MAG: VTC domain-containing protein [Singulisphaera sp.]
MRLDSPLAHDLERYLATVLHRDPHAAVSPDGTYQVTTLYTDTAQFDILHRTMPRQRRKFRLRRYGQEQCVYLEQKTRRQSRVRKKRSLVAADQVLELAQETASEGWAGRWFHQSLRRYGLRPVCAIGHRRTALIGPSEFGPIRVTFDRDLTALRTDRWSVGDHTTAGVPFCAQIICELKFSAALPGLFKDVLSRFRLTPGRFSKYRAAAHALGLVSMPAGDEQHA